MARSALEYVEKNDMIKERLDLYKDFTCDLVIKINETFLGDHLMGDKEKRDHFNWCWNKVIDEFGEQYIQFEKECELKEFLWYSFYDLYYESEEDKDEVRDNLLIMWTFVFDYRLEKNESEISFAINAYNKFDECLIR